MLLIIYVCCTQSIIEPYKVSTIYFKIQAAFWCCTVSYFCLNSFFELFSGMINSMCNDLVLYLIAQRYLRWIGSNSLTGLDLRFSCDFILLIFVFSHPGTSLAVVDSFKSLFLLIVYIQLLLWWTSLLICYRFLNYLCFFFFKFH